MDPESQNDNTITPSNNTTETNNTNGIPVSDEIAEAFTGPKPAETSNEDSNEMANENDNKIADEKPEEDKSQKIIASGPDPSPTKKSHKAAIISVVCIIIAAIGGIVFAVINSNLNKEKPTIAIENLTDEQKEKFGIKPEEKEEDKNASEIEDKNNYTEEYKKYLELSDEEKKELEVVPRKEKVPDDKLDDIKKDTDNDTLATLPEKFDLRNVINVTVGNQGDYGLCWDYASAKALETYMKLHGIDYDPSELQIDFLASSLMYGDRKLHDGGSFQLFADMASSIGTISEEKFSSLDINPDLYYYDSNANYDFFKLANNDTPLYITKTVDFPSITKTAGKVDNKTEEEVEEFRNLVKAHLMENGALYMVMDAPDSFFFQQSDGRNMYFYTPDSGHSNTTRGSHAMAIVGWDDTFSKDNFKGTGTGEGIEKPLHDGAYLVLNSWGDWWGENGYFWVSYDEYNIESQLSGIISTSLDNTTKIKDIDSPLIKDFIKEKLSFYIFENNGEEYISDYAFDQVSFFSRQSYNLNNSDIAKIAETFPNISTLEIDDNNVSDLSALANLKNLHNVFISKNKVTDITALCNTGEYSTVDLSYNSIADIGCLGDRLLNYASVDISGNYGITGLGKLTKASGLSANEIGLESLESLSTLNQLTDLAVKNNNIKDLTGLNTNEGSYYTIDISGNKNLTDITLDKSTYILNINNADLKDISILNNAKAALVFATGNNFGDLSAFNNDKIAQLDLSDNKNLSNISSLNTLKSLDLSNCNLSDLSSLNGLDNLERIVLSDNGIRSLEGIEKLKKLSSLIIDNSHLSSLEGISKLTNLNYFSADNNELSNAEELLELEKLYFVSLKNNKFTSIPNFSKQSELYLTIEENPLDIATIPKSVTTINLKKCNIEIMNYINGEKLTSINLEDNPDWNDYKNLISKSMLNQKNHGQYYPYIFVTTNYNFSKEELDNLDGIPGLSSHEDWFIQQKDYHYKLEKNDDNTISLENSPIIRSIFMTLLKRGVSMNGISIDKAATKITINDNSIKSLSFENYIMLNNNPHIYANTITFDLQ